MKKIVKTALLIIIFLNSSTIFAQLNEYVDEENNRILKAQQTEDEIERFINNNFKNYKLSKEISEEVKAHLREEEEFSDEEFETLFPYENNENKTEKKTDAVLVFLKKIDTQKDKKLVLDLIFFREK